MGGTHELNETNEGPGRKLLPWLVRAREASLLTGLSESWLRREASLGNIPHVRIGGLRFDVDRLREWIRAQEGRTLADPSIGRRHPRRA